MAITKRSLSPISLIVPALLALSAAATWSPQITTAGTGFVASVDIASNTATVMAGYVNPGYETYKYLYHTLAYEDASQNWHATGEWVYIDDTEYIATLNYPGQLAGYEELTDSNGDLAYGYASWN